MTGRIETVGLATVLATLVVTGSAEAYWHSTGAGSGSAGTATPVSAVVRVASPASDLHPGAAGSVTFTVGNTNGSPATFTRLTAATVTSANPTACASSMVSVAPPLPYSLPAPFTVAGGSTGSTQRLTSLLQMSSDAGNGCQDVGFTVSLTLTGSTN